MQLKYFCIILLNIVIAQSQNKIDSIYFTNSINFSQYELKQNLNESDLNSGKINNIIEALLLFYEENGFPFAKIKVDSIVNSLNLYLNINEGFKTNISEIDFSGNRISKKNILIRESKNIIGNYYSEKKIDLYRIKLINKGLVESISKPEIFLINYKNENNETNAGIFFEIVEKKYSTIDGIIAYSPNQNNKNYFSGLINYGNLNLLGTGRKLNLKWQRENEYTQEIDFKYSEPWVLNYPIDLSFNLIQRKQDTTYSKFNYSAILETFYFDNFKIEYKIEADEVFPSSNSASKTFHSRSFINGFNYNYFYRLNFKRKSDNINISTMILFKNKEFLNSDEKLVSPKKINQNISNLNIQVSKNIISSLRYYDNSSYKKLSSSNYEISDYFYLGGAKTIRGYKENQFFASEYIFTQNEVHFDLEEESSLFLFFDFCYFKINEDMFKQFKNANENIYGYGFGANIPFQFGNISLAFALAKNEKIGDAKLHLNFTNEF